MKKTIRLRESELKHIISESVKRVLKEAFDDETVFEEDVLFSDSDFFGDSEEHSYDMECKDGMAIGKLNDDSNAPGVIKVTYPKLDEVLSDEKLSNYILKYRGLHDLRPEDITYGDIMMALGKIVK